MSPVRFIVYSDYLCPWCYNASVRLRRLESEYEGQWKNGKKNGYGTFTYGNEDKYEGQWKEDMRHGKTAKFYNFEKKETTHSKWVDDVEQDYPRRTWGPLAGVALRFLDSKKMESHVCVP